RPPARKPGPAAAGAPEGQRAEAEHDETLLTGLPLFRKAPWLRWAVPLAAVLLLAVLGGVLWATLSGDRGRGRVASTGNNRSKDAAPKDQAKRKDADKDREKTEKDKEGSKPGPGKDKPEAPDKDKAARKDKKEPGPGPGKKPEDTNGVQPIPPATGKPSTERREAGRFT